MCATTAPSPLRERVQAENMVSRLSRSLGFAGLRTTFLAGEPPELPSGPVAPCEQTLKTGPGEIFPSPAVLVSSFA